MPPLDWDRVQSVFLSLADLPPADQAWRLNVECGGDDNLRDEVESLLTSDREGSKTISAAIAGEATLLEGDSAPPSGAAGPDPVGAWFSQAVPDPEDRAAGTSREGQRVGQWRLIRQLGQGGMGAVYLAERADGQYEYQAAIKLVRRGLDTDFILHRFRRERQSSRASIIPTSPGCSTGERRTTGCLISSWSMSTVPRSPVTPPNTI